MSSSHTPKALSSATMGMRFMQRNTPSNAIGKEMCSDQILFEKSKAANPQHSHQDHVSTPTRATAADMHGISAEIIGRRSFNNFHGSVEETWISAVRSRSQNKLDSKVERNQISDEELLQRYHKYVKGHGEVASSKSRSIGNLNKKKRKRQNE